MPTTSELSEHLLMLRLREELAKGMREFGVEPSSPLVLRVVRALEVPLSERVFCALCGGGFKRSRKWHRFCSDDCRAHYHGQRRIAAIAGR